VSTGEFYINWGDNIARDEPRLAQNPTPNKSLTLSEPHTGVIFSLPFQTGAVSSAMIQSTAKAAIDVL
jgi:hypothetical protein